MVFKGHFRAKFSPASNRLISAKLCFDTGAVLASVDKKTLLGGDAAAVEAANQADALLDSLEMPHMASVSKKVSVVPSTSSSSESSCKSEEDSSIESAANQDGIGRTDLDERSTDKELTTRRSQRLST
jgi:hypothetical protein